jgi:AraC-like DNA-binding protein
MPRNDPTRRSLEHHHPSGVERFAASWAGYVTQHHAHPEYQITLSVAGAGRCDYLGGRARIPAGCMMVFHPGEPHILSNAQRGTPWLLRSLHVPVRWLEAVRAPLLQPAPFVPEPALTAAFEAVWAAFERSRREQDEMERALARLAASLCARPGLDSHRRGSSELVRRCLTRLSTTLDRPLSMAELARLERATPARIRRAIGAHTGLSPSAWHLQRRIQLAKHALLRGEPIAATARAFGFSDQAHFTRHFTRLVGVTPSRYAAARRPV